MESISVQGEMGPAGVASERAVARIIHGTALAGSALLDGMLDSQISPGTDLPRQVASLPYNAPDCRLTTFHELRGERESEMFPGATHLVLTRGAAEPLLGRAAHEHWPEGPLPLDASRSASWHENIEDLERDGWRVLGIAWQPLEDLPSALDADLERDFCLLALLGIQETEHLAPATERSVARRIALQVLFELDCTGHGAQIVTDARLFSQNATRKQARYVRKLVNLVRKHRAILDEILRQYAIDWPPEQLAIVDRNILRMAILEFAIARSAPVAVVINEAIELARLFSGGESFDFINGVLGAIADEDLETEALSSRSRILRDYRASMLEQEEPGALAEVREAVLVNGESPVA
ncbi:MAG: transcription antitermination factor NusB [Anaerolineaceae bacterium]|nr:transcription antitermination factor NusB [Anaerolineaceae bacterium]